MTFAEFRAAFSREKFPLYSFSQDAELQGSSAKDPNSAAVTLRIDKDDATQTADIHEGVCIHASRMWIQARNLPSMISEADAATIPNCPILAFVKRHWESIMCMQALHQSGRSQGRLDGKAFDIAGLSILGQFRVEKSLFNRSTAGIYHHEIVKSSVHFAILIVAFDDGGSHAIAFDTRNGEFSMFDPNRGMLIAVNGAGSDTERLLRAWCALIRATPISVTTFSRN